MKFLSFQLLILLLFANPIFGQQISNLQVFKNLTDSISYKIIEALPDEMSTLSFPTNNSELNILYDFIKTKLINSGIKLTSDENYKEKISLSFSEVKVDYDKLFKEHLFGKYSMQRQVVLSGSFILEKKSQVFDFNFIGTDTVKFEEYRDLENKIYPFTEGQAPKEPFFTNLVEPVIAIVATATAVILFFTVRSK